jgi:transcription antitermination factor NusA-like protein
MAMKEPQRSVYKTARGAEIDMIKLVNQNEMTIAVGNAKVNARGDKIGPDGKIVRLAEDMTNYQVKITPAVAPAPVSTKKDVSNMDPEGKE